LEVRVSVHAGSALERDGDFFGSPANKVTRINGIGHGGQVLVSDVAHQLMLEPSGNARTPSEGEALIKWMKQNEGRCRTQHLRSARVEK